MSEVIARVQAALEGLTPGASGFTEVHRDEALAAAARTDPSLPLGGWTVSIKELFDMAGRPTPSGSTILAEGPIAARDAPVVARIKAAGAVILGRTHMSEFAFSGVGLNPHGPQLGSAIDPLRVPGGSSSGAGVSVGLGLVDAALGTDTGGSVRIPAALNGVVGFKPTARRITLKGATPLAPTLDSIGPLARSVAACRAVDAAIADQTPEQHPALAVSSLRLAVVSTLVLDELDAQVAADFDRALSRLSAAGARLDTVALPGFGRIPEIEPVAPLVAAEAYAVHRRNGWLDHPDAYDPNVLFRLKAGARPSAADYLDSLAGWAALAAEANALSAGYDALVWPTCPITAPPIADLIEPAAFGRANALLLRNPRLINLMDRCAISLPMQEQGALGTGLMLAGETLGDMKLLAVAEAVESVLR